MPDPGKWFLQFDTAGGQGRPWGDGTTMAGRAGHDDPWDEDCEVTPLIGGFAAMTAIRTALNKAVADAKASHNAAGDCGHVYIAGWRFNTQRDLSDGASAWNPSIPVAEDPTAIGLVLRLMQAGVRVRIMVWLPTQLQERGGGLAEHARDHYYLARVVAAESARVTLADPLGVVALDARTADLITAAHHQKMIVIRGLQEHVAFCGGVDLAFTRRDTPAPLTRPQPAFLQGDWQSAAGMPELDAPWPHDGSTDYTKLLSVTPETGKPGSDLPPNPDDPNDVYGFAAQHWHDQHLELRGPMVRTLEDQFAERWRDRGRLFDISSPANLFGGQVIFSSPDAIKNDAVVELPNSKDADPPAGGASPVQMWRTIPFRAVRRSPPFRFGEFTVIAGINHAVRQAEHLIWIFDQYFWSLPLARQINFELTRTDTPKPDLRVIVILPPYADTQQAIAHEARRRALDALTDGARSKVEVYNLWDHRSDRGIYCHAKVQTYDGGLLVCGSANLNRRSFLCDTELDCAVADEAVVAAHQQELWTLLFRDVSGAVGQWPGLDLDSAGSGAAFFSAFEDAAEDPDSYLWPDDWESASPATPNSVPLDRAIFMADTRIGRFADPSSVDEALIEGPFEFRDAAGQLQSRPPRLDDVVKRLDETLVRGGVTTMPNRRETPLIRLPLIEVDPNFSL